jgi:hypothetical protein
MLAQLQKITGADADYDRLSAMSAMLTTQDNWLCGVFLLLLLSYRVFPYCYLQRTCT